MAGHIIKLDIERNECSESVEFSVEEMKGDNGKPLYTVAMEFDSSEGCDCGFTMGEDGLNIGPGQLRKIVKFFRQCADHMESLCAKNQKDLNKVMGALQKLTPTEIESLGIDLDEFGIELAKT